MNKLMLAGIVFTAIGTIILMKVTELRKKARAHWKESACAYSSFYLEEHEPIAIVGYVVGPCLLLFGLILILVCAGS